MKSLLKFILNNFFTILTTAMIFFLFKACRQEIREDTARCEDHGRKPYTTETVFGTTSDGCTVNKIEKFTGDCASEGYVYVTNCQAACWDKPSGKTHVRECSVGSKK